MSDKTNEQNVSMDISDASSSNASNETESKGKQITPEQLEEILNKDVSVSLRLLYNFKNIVEVMCNRGALKASEMSGVGQLYNDVQKIITDNL